MTRQLRDGTRLQSAMWRSGRASSGPRGYPYPEQGVVIKVYQYDADGNRSRSYVECDVFLTRMNVLLRNVPMSFPIYGQHDGMEWIPREPSTPIAIDPPDIQAMQRSDADWVIVDFVGGRLPIIRGQMPRRLADMGDSYAPTVAQGRRMVIRHGDAKIELLENGDCQITVPDGQLLKLGSADGGEQYLVRTDKFKPIMEGHIHATGVGNSGPALDSLGNPLSNLAESDWSTEKVKAE